MQSLHLRNKQPALGRQLLANLHDGYARCSFESYPVRRGLPKEDLEAGNFLQEQQAHATALVQNWLFFGLLEEALRTPVLTKDFTQPADGGAFLLNTQRLGEFISQWQQRIEECSDEDKTAWAARLREVFREVFRFLQLFSSGLSTSFPSDFVAYLNPLAFLLDALQHQTTVLFADGAEHEPLPANFSPDATQALMQNGWCPFTVANILLPSASPSLFVYASSFDRCPVTIGQNHGDCDATYCAVTNVDTSTYKTRHNNLYCECEARCRTLIPNIGEVRALLEAEAIPIISSTEDGNLKISGHREGPYVAISHVWADGKFFIVDALAKTICKVGSTSEAGIPTCVVKFLSEVATAAYNSIIEAEAVATVPFWIDSLCVPKQPRLRQTAINLMGETYACAAAVVVIDSSILRLSVEDPVEEQLFVLYVSSWVQRLWTLKEALLSQQLLFRVSDGLIDFRYFFTDEVLQMRFSDPVATKLLGWFGQMMIGPMLRSAARVTGSTETQSSYTLDDVVLHLAKRTSTRPADEIFAIAGLFNLDPNEYWSLNPDQRMARFLSEYNRSRVPYDILFLDGPKLPVENYTWAPRTFMSRQMNLELKGTTEGNLSVVTEQGLLGQYYALVLREKWPDDGKPPPTTKIRVNDTQDLVLLFSRSVDLEDDPAPTYNVLVLQRAPEPGEEFLAAGCQLLEEDEDEVLSIELTCYVHVFNEDRNRAWNSLPVVNHALGTDRFVLVS